MAAVVFAGFQTLLNLIRSLGMPEFCNTLNGFRGIPVKIQKIWGNSWISSHVDKAFSTGFLMSSMGCVWIFSGKAQYSLSCLCLA